MTQSGEREPEVSVVLRPGRAADAAYVVKSWLRGHAEAVGVEEKAAGYWRAQKWIIADLLEAHGVVVACDANDADRIVGYACGEARPGQAVLHWVYVRESMRRRGVARMLVRDVVSRASADGADAGATRVVVTHRGDRAIRDLCTSRGWAFAPLAPAYRTIAKWIGAEERA